MSRKLVDTNTAFRPVYSLYKHEYLGILISANIVPELPNGMLSLQHQGLNPDNLPQFAHRLDEADIRLVALLDEIRPDVVADKYSPKSKRTGKRIAGNDFFLQKFSPEIQKLIQAYVNRRIAQALSLLVSKEVFEMGNDGYPAAKPVKVLEEPATVLFHLRRNETETRYFPTIKLRGERVEFMFKGAEMVCTQPAWMLLNGELFFFKKLKDGNKLRPFLNKRFISIPRSAEAAYFEKFVTHLVESYDVYAEGLEIRTHKDNPEFCLVVDNNGENNISLSLVADYGPFRVTLNNQSKIKALLEKSADSYIFHRVRRDEKLESEIKEFVDTLGKKNDSLLKWEFMDKQQSLTWLAEHVSILEKSGIRVEQIKQKGRLNFDEPEIVMEPAEAGDWFDIRAIVKIGAFSIPFIRFRNNILKGKRDFLLPDGTIAILPENWFTDYRHLIEVAVETSEEVISIRKYQAPLIPTGVNTSIGFKDKLENLAGVKQVEEEPLPAGVQATLRGYQQQGYDWLNFLKKYDLGGILADDMGLGKTLQTLTLILRQKEQATGMPTLVVMPTSLVYNWASEAKKFTPDLSILVYAGLNRDKNLDNFSKFDLLVTTYGTVRQDIEQLKNYPFDYVILDESQMIKNPDSKTYKAVTKLKASHRLSLTGTPLENTLMDLWSQMSFLNPGLLGSEKFFRDYYVGPIEKEADEKKRDQLRKIIHPFILRRTKEQVASELPPKVEQYHYCEMEEEQRELYDETKNAYRNYLMEMISNGEYQRNKFNLLAGLQKLRQIAIHPGLVEEGQGLRSGKYKEFIRMLQNVLEEGAKVLVFSQYVKFLDIIRKDLDFEKVDYAYLDGSTKDRAGVVNRFQEDPAIQVFLISLKAGGVGLNLTAAQYVFILDPWWNPAVENQAIDRTHRIGQDKTVFSYKFITRDSIEEKIIRLQQRKSKLSQEIISVDENVFKQLQGEELLELLD